MENEKFSRVTNSHHSGCTRNRNFSPSWGYTSILPTLFGEDGLKERDQEMHVNQVQNDFLSVVAPMRIAHEQEDLDSHPFPRRRSTRELLIFRDYTWRLVLTQNLTQINDSQYVETDVPLERIWIWSKILAQQTGPRFLCSTPCIVSWCDLLSVNEEASNWRRLSVAKFNAAICVDPSSYVTPAKIWHEWRD